MQPLTISVVVRERFIGIVYRAEIVDLTPDFLAILAVSVRSERVRSAWLFPKRSLSPRLGVPFSGLRF
jgi:hypothetical protein